MRSRHLAAAVVAVALTALAIAAGCSKSSSPTNPGTGGTGNTPFDSGVKNAGFTFTRTFPDSGDVSYFCTIHGAGMTGTVHITSTASSTSAAVNVINNAFDPNSVSVKRGGTVTWTWTGSNH